MTWLTMILLVSCLAGCGWTEGKPVTTCSWVKPIRPSWNDVLTRGTAQQIVTHNNAWAEINHIPLPKKKPRPHHGK